jgi:hypothetical protein
MPYEVRNDGDKWCVYNTDTGEKKACHDTEDEAERQVKLLHMIEHEE